jgi:hypothetical protein
VIVRRYGGADHAPDACPLPPSNRGGAHNDSVKAVGRCIREDRALAQGPWALGSGLALGGIADLSDRWRVQAEGFARAYLGGALQERGALFNTRWQLNADWNLTGQCQWQWRQEDGRALRGDRQCTAGLQRYF